MGVDVLSIDGFECEFISQYLSNAQVLVILERKTLVAWSWWVDILKKKKAVLMIPRYGCEIACESSQRAYDPIYRIGRICRWAWASSRVIPRGSCESEVCLLFDDAFKT